MPRPKNKRERLDVGEAKALPAFNTYYSDFGTPETMPEHFGVLRKTRKLCSDPRCCGNPRREKGCKRKTIQEVRADMSFNNELLSEE